MKYFNKEYGFNGRPPYFNEFFEETNKGPQVTPSCFPSRIIVGAGLDYRYPNGVSLFGTKGSMWGVRVSYQRNGKWIDGADFIKDRGRMYVARTDGSFAYFTHGDITVSSTTLDDNAIVMSISTISSTRVRVIFYSWDTCDGVFKATESVIKGSAPQHAVVKGEVVSDGANTIFKNRYDVLYSDKSGKEYFSADIYNKPRAVLHGDKNEVIYEYDLDQRGDTRIYLYATIGGKELLDMTPPDKKEIQDVISQAEINYSTVRLSGSGTLCSDIDRATTSAMWYRVYNPYFLSTTFMPSRHEINKYYPYDALRLNVANMIGGIIGDSDSAISSFVYATGDKITSLISAWVVYCRSRDDSMWDTLYPIYLGLIAPDSTPVIADADTKDMVAYRMDGSPLKELFKSGEMYSLDMCCIKVLSMDIMERIALLRGDKRTAKKYAEHRRKLSDFVNEELYNEDLGLYMNKYLSGEFATSIGITSFYPLIAGIIEDGTRLRSILKYLQNPRKFGGDVVIPTLSRDNPEYGRKVKDLFTGETIPAYERYRGMVVPYINYLVYMGLVRYGMTDLACEIAYKSNRTYKKYLDRSRPINKGCYLPNGKSHSTIPDGDISANLMAIIGMNCLIDVEYFRGDLTPAIRFGTTYRGEHSISNVRMLGHRYSVSSTDRDTSLRLDGVEVFHAEGGRCEVRQFRGVYANTEFLINATSNLVLNLKLPSSDSVMTELTFAVQEGKSRVKIVDGKVSVEKLNYAREV